MTASLFLGEKKEAECCDYRALSSRGRGNARRVALKREYVTLRNTF
jgi:hypothetical protein